MGRISSKAISDHKIVHYGRFYFTWIEWHENNIQKRKDILSSVISYIILHEY